MGFSWWLLAWVSLVVVGIGFSWWFLSGCFFFFFFEKLLWLLLVVGFGVGYCDYGGGCWPVLW